MCFFSNLARIIVCSTRRLNISPSDCVATRKVSHSHPVAVGWTSLVASRLREYEWNVMGIHYLLPFLRKLKIVIPCKEFVLRRQPTRFRKNRNRSLAQESTEMVAVTLTADGCVNNIKFRNYISGRKFYIKRITKRQRPSYARTFFSVFPTRRKYRIRKRRSPTPA